VATAIATAGRRRGGVEQSARLVLGAREQVPVAVVLAVAGGTVYIAGYGPLAPGIRGVPEFTTQ
jgi:hypothetical protein